MAITGRLRRSVVSRRSGERFVIPEPERQLFGGGLAFRGGTGLVLPLEVPLLRGPSWQGPSSVRWRGLSILRSK